MEREGRNDIAIIEMAEAHIAEVVEIEFDSFSNPWRPSLFRKILRDEKTRSIVAVMPDRVVGYAVFWVVGDYAELGDIAVGKEWRRGGIGDRLMKGVIAICKVLGARSLFLEVRESNTAARGLYLKSGFKEVMHRKRYYSMPLEDAIVLGLDLETMGSDGGLGGRPSGGG